MSATEPFKGSHDIQDLPCVKILVLGEYPCQPQCSKRTLIPLNVHNKAAKVIAVRLWQGVTFVSRDAAHLTTSWIVKLFCSNMVLCVCVEEQRDCFNGSRVCVLLNKRTRQACTWWKSFGSHRECVTVTMSNEKRFFSCMDQFLDMEYVWNREFWRAYQSLLWQKKIQKAKTTWNFLEACKAFIAVSDFYAKDLSSTQRFSVRICTR